MSRPVGPATATRFRAADGRRWRPGHLRAVRRVEDARFVVELVEARNGAHRTLDSSTWQVEIAEGRRWLTVARWVDGTPPLDLAPADGPA